MAQIPVKYFTSSMAGAPVVSNNWGDLIGLLDACLVTGFATKAVDSLTFSGGIATATISAGHSYQPYQAVEIAGADQPEYNGQFRVLTATSTTFTYAVTGSPVSPATTAAAISAKVAPLGWVKAFSDTNKAAYRSANPQSPQNLLLVDDSLKASGYNTSWAKWANVGVVEDMTDIDTIVGAQAPYDPNKPNANWKQFEANQWGWHKWYHARQGGDETAGDSGSGARNWVLVGDDRMFYLFITNAPGYNWYGRNAYCFGDINSFKPGDQYGTVLDAHDVYWSNFNQSFIYPSDWGGIGVLKSVDYYGHVLLRNHTQLGNYVRFGVTSLNIANTQQISGRGTLPFPNGADYSLWLLPSYVLQEDGHMRGMMPGMYWMPQYLPYPDQTVINNVVGQQDKKFLLVRSSFDADPAGAQVAFDITGPWR
jgi:hypothetical protein